MTAVRTLLHHPATWLVAALWGVSATYLSVIGQAERTLIWAAYGLFELTLAAITVWLTRPMPADAATTRPSRTLPLQFAVIALFALLNPATPIWSSIWAQLQAFGESAIPVELVGGPGNAISNPVQYFVLPFILLLLLGARPRELGFGPGHRTWRVAALWSAVPVLGLTILLLAGQAPFTWIIRRILGNALQNGFFEEFLFRGALQTRLGQIMTPAWALVIQAILFGLWHLPANIGEDGNVIAAVAICFVSQMISGLAYGIVFMRTRNLIAPSVAHTLMNAFGQSVGG
jgi:hypothetical protein